MNHHKSLPRRLGIGVGLAALVAATAAVADINVGVTLSATGPAASLGIPEKNTFDLIGTPTVAGQKVVFTVLDDASDTTRAVTNTRKLISENKVDLIIGSTVTPNSLAMIDVVAEAETPMISMAASAAIISPMDAKRRWVFKTPQNDALMAEAIGEHMKASGVKSMAYLGFADAYGEGWLRVMQGVAQAHGITIAATEKFNRTDTSVTGQVLKIVSTNPDAVLIGASGTPGALPQLELVQRGYKGRIYQTHGVANNDFLRVGGANVNGALLPVGPMLVFEQLPDTNPIKKVAADYIGKYEAKHGAGSRSTFGGHSWDAWLLLQQAAPEALKKAQPGTPQFRAALRDALEGIRELVGVHGVFNMSPADHIGFDARARVMIRIDNGKWLIAR